jgi:hypothetical protein
MHVTNLFAQDILYSTMLRQRSQPFKLRGNTENAIESATATRSIFYCALRRAELLSQKQPHLVLRSETLRLNSSCHGEVANNEARLRFQENTGRQGTQPA